MGLGLPLENIRDVAESQLCCGCGLCAYLDPAHVTMVDDLEQGRRPIVLSDSVDSVSHREAFAACPGRGLTLTAPPAGSESFKKLRESWGPVLGIWEGHATDRGIRFAGSSGGVATALAAFVIEKRGFAGALHIAARNDVPLLNETVLSKTRQELLSRTGSRYAPASPCDRLDLIESAESPCVFIGKPCDVAGAQAAATIRPQLNSKLGLTIAIFCAGTPSTRGTIEVLRAMGIQDVSHVKAIRYRGNGWPGMFSVQVATDDGERLYEMTYDQSWGEILQKHRQWRCYICPDHTGEFADIAVGDPWHTPPSGGEPGRSLIVARTKRGVEYVEAAISEGVLDVTPSPPEVLVRSQLNVLRVRSAIFPRLLALRLCGAAIPSYKGFYLFHNWWRRTTGLEKVRQVLSTFVRVWRKSLNRRRRVRSLSQNWLSKKG